MTIKTALKVGGALALLWWLERSKKKPSGDPSVLLSSFVRKDGQCYRVDLMAAGGSRSVLVDGSKCDDDADPNEGLEDVVDDPALGFRQLVHLFDDL